MAAPTTVLTVIKRFLYRGDPNEEYSNRYMLTGATPADSAAWRTLFDAMVVEEKKLYSGTTYVIRGYGHDTPDPHADAVWSVDLRVPPNTPVQGTYTAGAGAMLGGGDSAAWIRWGLNRMVNGKRVYVRKYFHPAFTDGSDSILPTWTTAAQAFGAKMHDGTFGGSRVITDKLGSSVLNHGVSQYATTRTLKRRGKRRPSS